MTRSRHPFCHSGLFVTPVKTGVHPNPINLDTVFQRYDGARIRYPVFTMSGMQDLPSLSRIQNLRSKRQSSDRIVGENRFKRDCYSNPEDS